MAANNGPHGEEPHPQPTSQNTPLTPTHILIAVLVLMSDKGAYQRRSHALEEASLVSIEASRFCFQCLAQGAALATLACSFFATRCSSEHNGGSHVWQLPRQGVGKLSMRFPEGLPPPLSTDDDNDDDDDATMTQISCSASR